MPTRDWRSLVQAPSAPYEKSKSLGSGGSMVARLKLKEIDGRAPPGKYIIAISTLSPDLFYCMTHISHISYLIF